MDNNTIMILLGFVVAMIGIMTPVIKLNKTITEFSCAIAELRQLLSGTTDAVDKQGEQLKDHENRIVKLECESEFQCNKK